MLLRSEAISQQVLLKGQATAERIKQIGEAFGEVQGESGAKFKLGEKYISALRNLGDEKKSLIIRANLNNPREILEKALGNTVDIDKLLQELDSAKPAEK